MTAQILDAVVFKQRGFGLLASEGTALFDPRMHGLEPQSMGSACWRGFCCVYRVDEGPLLLDALRIGVKPLDRLRARYGKAKPFLGQWPQLEEESSICAYAQLQWRIPFTGGLLLGRDFIRGLLYREESVVNSASMPIWMFKEVHELHFAEGQLADSFDCSGEMDVIRNRIQEHAASGTKVADGSGIHMSLMNAFRRDYGRKVQW